MSIGTVLTSVCLCFSHALAAGPKTSPLTATAQLRPFELEPHQVSELEITLHLQEGFKAYADQLKVQISAPQGFKVAKFEVTPTIEFFDKFSKKNRKGFSKEAKLKAVIEAPGDLSSQANELDVQLTYQACNANFCLFPEKVLLKASYKFKSPVADTPSLPVKDIFEHGLLWTFVLIFLAGILTSFTPCIFPMIPITLTVLGRAAHARTRGQNFLVSIFYVLGIAVTYAFLGVLAASTGALFGSFMSHPAVLAVMCLMFLLMALSMFGLFDFEMPAFIQNRLGTPSKLHGYSGIFLTGVAAGIVASPCVGPVLVGILTYIAKTQNLLLGFTLMFVYALGMGQIFLVLGVFSQATKLLPKSGPWLEWVKRLFGVLMLGVFCYFFALLLPALSPQQKWVSEKSTAPHGNWQPFTREALANAAKKGRPVIVDFGADWCLACKELEQYTFTTPAFLKLAESFALLKYDATASSEELDQLRKEYEIVGLPTLLFFNKKGELQKELTLTAFEEAEPFVQRMQKALAD